MFKFRLFPFFRWASIWAIVSIDIVFGAFIVDMENAMTIAWMTIWAWAFYWAIIDIVATKFSWEGPALLSERDLLEIR